MAQNLNDPVHGMFQVGPGRPGGSHRARCHLAGLSTSGGQMFSETSTGAQAKFDPKRSALGQTTTSPPPDQETFVVLAPRKRKTSFLQL